MKTSSVLISEIFRPGIPALNRQNLYVVSILALVFLAGASAGALTMSLGLHGKLHPRGINSHGPSREVVLRSFKTNLDLTPEQTGEISMVLEDYRQYYESLREQLDDLRSSGESRVLQVLEPAQRDKFEKMITVLAPQLDSGREFTH
jgi:hypothetical protein